MTELSQEQRAIVFAPLSPFAVVACAGSGKTMTAVRRLVEMRRLLGDSRGRVALLSFSNIAVETFRNGYRSLSSDLPLSNGANRIEIDTLDGFFTSNILRPHGHRIMTADKAAFLVTGAEPFLQGFKFNSGSYPLEITKLQVGFRDGAVYFLHHERDQILELDSAYALGIIRRLGRTGAYTHNLGRYWSYRLLAEDPVILRAMVQRYPHILIDESQDIGTLHQAMLAQLSKAGAQVSLIGDPCQGIYDFAGADGKFLSSYGLRKGVTSYALTRNYRSVPSILNLSNRLSGRHDTPERATPEGPHGTYFCTYKNTDQENLVAAFRAAVIASGLKPEQSAVVCRTRSLAEKLSGKDVTIGMGLVKSFAAAAILRDKRKDYLGAFRMVAACMSSLLKGPPRDLEAQITQSARHPKARPLRLEVWKFTRNSVSGLPSAFLNANAEWHPLLLARVKGLLKLLQLNFSLTTADNLGSKLSKRDLLNAPLASKDDLADEEVTRIRVDTVHQVKGESLDAVLYIATKENAVALLDGVNTEVGRIGYVAVTRARNLFWLGIPAASVAVLRPKLLAVGILEVK
jgi:superfamily I DNA/RNA helicase